MNTQLVDSIIQLIQTLPKPEQNILIEKLNQLGKQTQTIPENTAELKNDKAVASIQESIDQEAWEVWHSLGDDAVPGCLNLSTNPL